MFENITRDQFRIDAVLPLIQTAVTLAVTQAAGRLGHYSISAQSTVLVAYAAAMLSSLANNFFAEALFQYLAIPVSVGAGLLVHRFFYPGTELSLVANAKEILIISGILIAVKLIAENAHRFKFKLEKGEEAAEDVEKEAEKAVKGVDKKAEKAAKKAEKKAEKAAKDVEKEGAESGKNVGEKIADVAKKVEEKVTKAASAAGDKIKEVIRGTK